MTEPRTFPGLRETLTPPPPEAGWQARLRSAARSTPQSPSPGVAAWLLWSSPARWAPAAAFALAVLWTGGLLGVVSMQDAPLAPTLQAAQTGAAQSENDAEENVAAGYFAAEEDYSDILEYFDRMISGEEFAEEDAADYWNYAGF